MIFAPESQQVIDHFAVEIEDLRTIARLHALPTGTPERLAALPLRLSKDTRLRSDLTEFVRSLQTRDSDLALPDALSMVLVAVGGPSALERSRDLAEPVDLTGGFLASLGGWPGSAVEPLIDIDNPPDHDPRLDLAAAGHTESLQADLTGRAGADESEPASGVVLDEDRTRDPDGSVNLAEITQALARLERGNLELRLHLDSIDQRICRMEPLLEAAPVQAVPEPEPDPPSPPTLPRSPYLQLTDAPLVHRGSDLSGAPSPLRDRNEGHAGHDDFGERQEERRHRGSESREGFEERRGRRDELIAHNELDALDQLKERRRISLTSHFAESAPVPATAPAPLETRPTSEPPRPPLSASPATLPGSVVDPVPHPRMHQPRRDRFAAAREIPGTAAEFDPLYTAPDAEPSRSHTFESHSSEYQNSESRVFTPFLQRADQPGADPDPKPALHPVTPEITPKIEQPEAPSTALAPAPAAYDPAPRAVAQSSRPLSQAGPPPNAQNQTVEPATAPLLNTRSSLPLAAMAEEPKSRRSPWLAALAAAAVIGAAGFLYVNGLPSAINEWVSGSTTTVSTNTGADDPQKASSSTSQSDQPSPAPPTARAGKSASGAAGRVLGARDSFTPTQSIERTNGPTFVPGGIMDGYLVAAPRPDYPRLANLAGVQGKVSLEAMISKEGQVEALKVLGGPQLLRDAATKAVQQWQYRPFEVKGRPVEVRTIIRVDVASRTGAPTAQ